MMEGEGCALLPESASQVDEGDSSPMGTPGAAPVEGDNSPMRAPGAAEEAVESGAIRAEESPSTERALFDDDLSGDDEPPDDRAEEANARRSDPVAATAAPSDGRARDAWERILPRAARDASSRVVEYPQRGWEKWRPILLDQVVTTFKVFFWLVLIEGFLLESMEVLLSGGKVSDELWFASTVYAGKRPYRPGACHPTFFDELFSNGIEALVAVLAVLASMAYGHAPARVFVHADAVTLQFATPTYGVKRLSFKDAEVAEVLPWRRILGKTQHADRCVWVGTRHWVDVQETGHLDDALRNVLMPTSGPQKGARRTFEGSRRSRSGSPRFSRVLDECSSLVDFSNDGCV